MEQKEILKQMIDFNKIAFDNTFNILNLLQEQWERMTGVLVEQSARPPPGGKYLVNGPRLTKNGTRIVKRRWPIILRGWKSSWKNPGRPKGPNQFRSSVLGQGEKTPAEETRPAESRIWSGRPGRQGKILNNDLPIGGRKLSGVSPAWFEAALAPFWNG